MASWVDYASTLSLSGPTLLEKGGHSLRRIVAQGRGGFERPSRSREKCKKRQLRRRYALQHRACIQIRLWIRSAAAAGSHTMHACHSVSGAVKEAEDEVHGVLGKIQGK